MIKTRTVVFSVVGVLLLVGLLFGAGAAGYRFGYIRGVAQGAQITTGQAVPSQGAVPLPGYGYGYRPDRMPGNWMLPHARFSPFGIIAAIFGLFLVGLLFLGVLRLVFRPFFWGPMHGRPWGGSPWGGPSWVHHSHEGEEQPKAPESKPEEKA